MSTRIIKRATRVDRRNVAGDHGRLSARSWVPSNAAPCQRHYVATITILLTFLFLGGLFNIPFFGVAQFSGERSGNWASSLFNPFSILLYSTIFILVFRRHEKLVPVLRCNILLMILLGLVAISALWSVDPSATLRRTFALFGTTGAALLCIQYFSYHNILKLIAVSFAVLLLFCLAAVVIAPSLAVHHFDHVGAWRGVFTHKNNLGWFAAVSMVLFLSCIFFRLLSLIFCLICISAGLVLLVFSTSTTGALGAIVGMMGILFVWMVKRFRKLIPELSIIFTSFVLFISFIHETVLTKILGAFGKSPTLTGRTTLWELTYQDFLARPVLGYGYNAYWEMEYSSVDNLTWDAGHAHNGYLELALGLGAVGVAAYMIGVFSAMIRLVKYASRGDRIAGTLFVALLAIHFMAISAGIILGRNSVFWALTLLGWLYRPELRSAPRAKIDNPI